MKRYVLTSVLLAGVLSHLRLSQANEQVLWFGAPNGSIYPNGGVVQGSDGLLYGTSESTVFRLGRDGTGFAVLHQFGLTPNGATNPVGPLLIGADHVFYAPAFGGTTGAGGIFKLNTDGTGYSLIYSFQNGTNGEVLPQGPLVQGTNGVLYGTTYFGGTSNLGTVYCVNPDGTGYRLLHSFNGSPFDGANPQAALIQDTNGTLYGTTTTGGTRPIVYQFSGGTVFKLNPDGTGFTLLRSFPDDVNDGSVLKAPLLQGKDGALYGTTQSGGSKQILGNFLSGGTVFRINTDGTGYSILHSFDGNAPLANPRAPLVQDSNGILYGTTSADYASGTVFSLSPDGKRYALLHIFGSFTGDGITPQGPLIVGTDGALYGTTLYGGISNYGTVFRLTTVPPPPFLLTLLRDASAYHVNFDGTPGATYRLEVSTNLLDWLPLGTLFNENGPVEFLDASATGASLRFYRAVWVP
jgi:uncharacterized repeat protein (TIGR03803 family)